MKTALISGITGQDGAYLSKMLLEKGYKVVGLTRSYNHNNLAKLQYLNVINDVHIEECDLLDISSVLKIITKYRPDEIYNLAAQSSVGLSFEQPIGTFSFNTMSVLNLLESIKLINTGIKLYQASSSEMFGSVNKLPINEDTAFHPMSPYAISKASAHWTVVNYRESFSLFACSGILFNHESYLRSDNFFVKKVIKEAVNIKNGVQKVIKVGDIEIKRDFGYAPKYVEAMYLMMQQEYSDDYIICSGKSIALKDIVYYVFDYLGLDRDRIIVDKSLFRPLEIKNIYGDNTKAEQKLGWQYDMSFFTVLELLINEVIKNYI